MKNILPVLLCMLTANVYAQKSKDGFEVRISDNQCLQYQSVQYQVTSDSLIITGLSDYGRSRVDYLQRALTEEERKILAACFKNFKTDDLQELYFRDYSNLAYISADHAPRVIDVELAINGKLRKVRINNSYVPRFAGLFQTLNPLLPEEAKIKYEAKDFEKER